LTASLDGMVCLWDLAIAGGFPPLRHQDRVFQARFSPDGRRILTASHDGTARIWNAATGQPVGHRMRHPEGVIRAEFSPDGRRVATATGDWWLSKSAGTARVWDAATGDPLTPPMRHSGTVRRVSFSPDGRRLLTQTGDG